MTQLGKYELHEVIGKGGFGTVYRATDTFLGRVVAIKVLNQKWMEEGSDAVERFHREAQVMAQLDHPNVVTVYEVGEAAGRLFIVMRYYPGKSLADIIKGGLIPLDRILSFLGDVCAGMQTAHAKGWVHRDLKPANILFDADGRAVVSDFGLARAITVSSSMASSRGEIGTPFYRAPELWRNKPPASPATDVYSLGCILGEMLTGKVLFHGDTPDEILTRHLIDGPDFDPNWPPAGMPPGLKIVVEKAIRKEPVERYADASGFLKGLKEGLAQPAAVRKPEPQVVAPAPAVLPAGSRLEGGHLFVHLAEGLEMEFIHIPAGEFMMGAAKGDTQAELNERPQHLVSLDEFWIGRFPVTNVQYATFVKAEGRAAPVHWTSGKIPEKKANHPVVNVKWLDASAFCDWLSEKSRLLIRLPTEAQWEKAARGTDGRIYPWGNQLPHGCCNFGNIVGDTTPVGKYSPQGDTPYGCVDMAGNVSEWVVDWYQADYYKTSPKANPSGPGSGNYRMLRGGSWYYSEGYLRSSYRWINPGGRDVINGFRCARSTST